MTSDPWNDMANCKLDCRQIKSWLMRCNFSRLVALSIRKCVGPGICFALQNTGRKIGSWDSMHPRSKPIDYGALALLKGRKSCLKHDWKNWFLSGQKQAISRSWTIKSYSWVKFPLPIATHFPLNNLLEDNPQGLWRWSGPLFACSCFFLIPSECATEARKWSCFPRPYPPTTELHFNIIANKIKNMGSIVFSADELPIIIAFNDLFGIKNWG